jgi:transcriptional regulator with XRE-family HTH domain
MMMPICTGLMSVDSPNATQVIALVATLMKVESGTVNKPSVQTMAKIAKALDVPIDELIKG